MGRKRTHPTDLPPHVHKRGDVYYFVAYDRGVRLWLRMTADRAQVDALADGLRAKYAMHVPGDLRSEVQRRDGFACRYCGATTNLELDHVVPLSRGGANSLQNIVLACRSCNSSKNSRHPRRFVEIVENLARGTIENK